MYAVCNARERYMQRRSQGLLSLPARRLRCSNDAMHSSRGCSPQIMTAVDLRWSWSFAWRGARSWWRYYKSSAERRRRRDEPRRAHYAHRIYPRKVSWAEEITRKKKYHCLGAGSLWLNPLLHECLEELNVVYRCPKEYVHFLSMQEGKAQNKNASSQQRF